MMWLWSWILTATGVFSIAVAGKRPALGWSIGFFSQGLWVAYAIQVHQYGFLASAALFAGVYGRNWYLAAKKGASSGKGMDRGREAADGRDEARERASA